MHFPFNNSSIDIISGTDYFSTLTRTYKSSSPASPILNTSYLDGYTSPIFKASGANLTQLNTTTLSFSCWIAFQSASLGITVGYYMVFYNPSLERGITITNKLSGGAGSNSIVSLEFYPSPTIINIFTVTAANTWYHIACTINNNILNVYIDGTRVVNGTTLASSPVGGAYDGISFGTNHSGNLPKPCYMEDVRFYNRILTQSDVTAIYNYRG